MKETKNSQGQILQDSVEEQFCTIEHFLPSFGTSTRRASCVSFIMKMGDTLYKTPPY